MHNGAMGAGAADAPDIGHKASGDATGGGDPGDQDDMGADDGRTVEEGAGRTSDPEALGDEREEYPDPASYSTPEEGETEILDGETPDADLRMDEPEGSEANGRT